ncbi:hypothetical protein [Rhodococcus zopfii]|uniref:hypothetical protein n=1 Tax=Rhodococcus zopfii TaxID=43772 RepID=UPI000A56E16C
MTTTPAGRRKQRTWSQFGEVKRKPTPYEAVTGKFHYHFRREPAPFELDPTTPINTWYLNNREGSPLQVEDWEAFRDPYKLTYRDYVAMQHEREIFVDSLVDRSEASGLVDGLDPAWVATLADVLVPMRFPIHALQMVSLYVGQMAPSSYITNCAHFQAADEMRRIQRIAYWTKVLANTHGDGIAETARSREIWESDPAWQPLRKALETLLISYDWGVGLHGPLRRRQAHAGHALQRLPERSRGTERRPVRRRAGRGVRPRFGPQPGLDAGADNLCARAGPVAVRGARGVGLEVGARRRRGGHRSRSGPGQGSGPARPGGRGEEGCRDPRGVHHWHRHLTRRFSGPALRPREPPGPTV